MSRVKEAAIAAARPFTERQPIQSCVTIEMIATMIEAALAARDAERECFSCGSGVHDRCASCTVEMGT